MNELAQFKATFFAECSELLLETEEIFARIEQGARDPELLHAAFRAIHSIKGGAGAFGFDDLVAFTHALETLLDLVRDEKIAPSADVIGLCIRALDIVADFVGAARDGASLSPEHGTDIRARIERMAGIEATLEPLPDSFEDLDFTPVRADASDTPADAVPGHKHWLIRFAPHRALFERANEPILILRELAALGTVEVEARLGDVPALEDFDPTKPLIGWTIHLESAASRAEIEAVFEFVEGDCDLSIEEAGTQPTPSLFGLIDIVAPPVSNSASTPGNGASDPARNADTAATIPKPAPGDASREAHAASIRVDLDKVERVVDMVGELVITQAMLTQQIDDHLRERYPDIVRGLEVLAQHTRSLQDSVMSIRAQPVKSVFARMSRLVRELSSQLGKRARIEMHGETTEIDKTVVEQLSEPLTHMIRNSLDHGIEKPQARFAAGKPEEGVIRLSAAQAGGRIIVQVADDGAGIDRARILAKAIERGVIAPGTILSEEETDGLIFAPGFSTAEAITNVSGRGVGMDVVRRNIQKLGGRVGVKNTPGRGMTVTMTLPLTLAVLDIMLVRVGPTPFVVPLQSIVESMKVDRAALGQLPSGGQVLRARGAYVQVIDLAGLFRIRRRPIAECEDGFIILCESDGEPRTALVVDQILGQQQVVIKSLETNFERLEGIAGATILGDGSVALILDIDGLRRIAEKSAAAGIAA